jgi:hypothetical protein
LTTWSTGQTLPRLEGLCRISFHLGIPLLGIAQGNIQNGVSRSPVKRLVGSGGRDLRLDDHSEAAAGRTDHTRGGKLTECEIAQAVSCALEENPPPSLYKLAKRLGYANSVGLKRNHPEACVELGLKQIGWRQQTLEQLRTKLEEAFLDEEPRAVKQVCRDIGVREKVIHDQFPDLKLRLRDRHAAWLLTDRSRKQLQLEFAVKKAVQRVQDCGEYPSANNVLADSNSLRFAGWERLQAAINKARNA